MTNRKITGTPHRSPREPPAYQDVGIRAEESKAFQEFLWTAGCVSGSMRSPWAGGVCTGAGLTVWPHVPSVRSVGLGPAGTGPCGRWWGLTPGSQQVTPSFWVSLPSILGAGSVLCLRAERFRFPWAGLQSAHLRGRVGTQASTVSVFLPKGMF